MAFQFQEPFNEGDKQTNPETGIEYIYKDGVWHVLLGAGSDSLDDYLPLAGGTMTGEIRLDPPTNGSGVSRVRVMKTHGDNEFHLTTHPATTGILSDAKVHVEIKNTVAEGPETILRFLPENPGGENHAVSKKYVDTVAGDYLPLSGGTLTGTLNGKLIKATRTGSGYAIEVKPDGEDTKAFVRTNGTVEIKATPGNATDNVFQVKPEGYNNFQAAFKVTNDGKVKAGHSASDPFMATSNNDVVTKKYFDENKGSNLVVPIVSSNPSNPALGELWYHTGNQQLMLRYQ